MDQKLTLAAALLVIGIPILISLHTSRHGTPEKRSVNASFYSNGSQTSWASLQVADNKTEREEGLMNRTELGKHRGMLFVFEDEAMRSFWMKNTYIPLNIIFLDANRTVINVEDARPQLNVSDADLKRYRSDLPAKYVIEVNEGFAANFSVSEGSRVSW